MAFTLDTHLRFQANATNPTTSAYTCGAGTTLLVLTIVTGGSAPVAMRTGGAPTYNGVAMSAVGSASGPSGTNETTAEIYYMANPPTRSSLTISIPNAASQNIAAQAISFIGPSGKTPFIDSFSAGNNTSTNPAITHGLGGAQGCCLVGVIGSGAQTWAPSARTGTQLDDVDVGAFGDGEQYFLAPTASQSIGWTFGTSDDWVICGASFAHDLSGLPNNYQAIDALISNLIDSYSEINQDSNSSISGAAAGLSGISQSFTGNGETISQAKFYIAASGSPTGTATANIYAHSGVYGTSSIPTGAALATSDAFDVTVLGASFNLFTFNFTGANQITLTTGTNYVLTIESTSTFGVKVGYDSSTPTHGGNLASQNHDTQVWSPAANGDMCFYLYSANPGLSVTEKIR